MEVVTLGTATTSTQILSMHYEKLSFKLGRMELLGNLHSLCILDQTFSFLDVTLVHSATHSLPVAAHTAALY